MKGAVGRANREETAEGGQEQEGEEEGTDLSSSNLVSPCLLESHHRWTDTDRGEGDG